MVTAASKPGCTCAAQNPEWRSDIHACYPTCPTWGQAATVPPPMATIPAAAVAPEPTPAPPDPFAPAQPPAAAPVVGGALGQPFQPRPSDEFEVLPTLAFTRGMPHGTFTPNEYEADGTPTRYLTSSFDATVDVIREVDTQFGARTVMDFEAVTGLPGGRGTHWPNSELAYQVQQGNVMQGKRYRFELPAAGGRYHNLVITPWV